MGLRPEQEQAGFTELFGKQGGQYLICTLGLWARDQRRPETTWEAPADPGTLAPLHPFGAFLETQQRVRRCCSVGTCGLSESGLGEGVCLVLVYQWVVSESGLDHTWAGYVTLE